MKKLLITTFIFSLFFLPLSAQQLDPALNDTVDNGDGSYTNWFGTFSIPGGGSPSNQTWVDHFEHGRLYLVSAGEGVWLYDANVDALGDDFSGWIYTNRSFFPYFIVNTSPLTYLLFVEGVEGPKGTPRVFLNPQTFDKVLLSKSTTKTVVDTAIEGEAFSSLVAAVSRAGLVETLSSEGPFTVFAPVNTAFEALDSDLLNNLLTNDEFLPLLGDILTYHVVPGHLDSGTLGLDLGSLLAGETFSGYMETVSGADLKVDVTPFGIMLNDTTMVTVPDVNVSNGVIHVINEVLVPPANIAEVASSAGFETLVTALGVAGLAEEISTGGPYTVFAPTEAAFGELGDTLNDLIADPQALGNILKYHVVQGKVYFNDVAPGSVPMLSGDMATISVNEEGKVFIDDAEIITVDIPAFNGVIHIINKVITP